MHDPDVVAFEIRRPWPKRERLYDSVDPKRLGRAGPRWRFKLHHDCSDCSEQEQADHTRPVFPWYRPSSWSPFWTVAGRGYYWPSLITVWHREPGGHDSGEVCKHYVRTQGADGKWQATITKGWRFHVHHWKIQIRPLQELRRWALTRCAWCGGRSVKSNPVNISHQWDGPRGRWWQGAPGLYHHDCSSVERAWHACVCESPIFEHDGWGKCLVCDKFRAHGRNEVFVAADQVLAEVPRGARPSPAVMEQVRRAWATARQFEDA